MKELSRKFSADDDELQHQNPQSAGRQPDQNRPVCRDLHFVVKESLNLGFRFIDEMDRMFRKIKEDAPEKQEKKEDTE